MFKTLPIGVGWALLSTSPVISLFFASNDDDDQDGGKLIKSLERINYN